MMFVHLQIIGLILFPLLQARAAFCHYGMVWIPADGAAIPAEAPGASGNNDAA